MSKSWREPSKGTFGKGKGFNGKRDATRKSEEKARKEIERLCRRTGEKIESYFD